MEWTTTAQETAPAAAGAVALAPSASSWVNSALFELLASAPAALLVTGINISISGTAQPFEIDLGVGAAGLEAVVTAFRGDYKDASFRGPGYIPHVIPLDAIPSGSRISARLRKNGTSVTPWKVCATYLRKPITGNLTTTAKPQKVAPASAVLTVTTAASAWGNGSWGTVLASAASDIVITGLVLPVLGGGQEWEGDLGVGAAASETVITTEHAVRDNSISDGPSVFPLANPLDIVLSGQRVAARIRGAEAAARSLTVAIVYHEKPL